MTITVQGNGTLIKFGNMLNTKIKILFWLSAIGSLLLCVAYLWFDEDFSIEDRSESWYIIFALVIIVVYFVVFIQYAKRVLRKESMLITRDSIYLRSTILNIKKENVFELSKISEFVYTGKAPKTDHPLKGQSYDYLGFETQELVIAEVHDEGNLSFNYEGKTIHFGRNVYSWDAEKINEILVKVTNGVLIIGNLPESIDESELYDN